MWLHSSLSALNEVLWHHHLVCSALGEVPITQSLRICVRSLDIITQRIWVRSVIFVASRWGGHETLFPAYLTLAHHLLVSFWHITQSFLRLVRSHDIIFRFKRIWVGACVWTSGSVPTFLGSLCGELLGQTRFSFGLSVGKLLTIICGVHRLRAIWLAWNSVLRVHMTSSPSLLGSGWGRWTLLPNIWGCRGGQMTPSPSPLLSSWLNLPDLISCWLYRLWQRHPNSRATRTIIMPFVFSHIWKQHRIMASP